MPLLVRESKLKPGSQRLRKIKEAEAYAINEKKETVEER